ncbi:hypothetical protein T10_11792 [Trichinella papuae]|uniref:Uncharacterized protein n=1 Tax=Trichinella papuae TaxID=268474 RepID=A0A0V1MLN7_9BILA|nr:hypothetical protein T10_11792 [Trichinella papuae]
MVKGIHTRLRFIVKQNDIWFFFVIYTYCIIVVHGGQQQDALLSFRDVAHKSELPIEAKQ